MGQGQEKELRLTFNNTNWNAYQTVTIKTDNNPYSGTNPPVDIKHTVSSLGDYAGVTAENFTLTITDDEFESAAERILLSLNPPAVDEDEEDGIAMVRLTAELDGPPRNEDTVVSLIINDPGEDLPMGISMEDIAEIGVDFTLSDPKSSRFELTIPARMKNTETVLVLNLVNDNVDEGDSETIVISGEVISGDAESLEIAPVLWYIRDDDNRGVTVSQDSLTVAEDATPVTYTVVLTSKPAEGEEVVVQLSVVYPLVEDGLAQDRVLLNGELDQWTLIFEGNSGNLWNEKQAVGVTLEVNEDRSGARTATIEHSVSGADYDELVEVEDVSLNLTDHGVIVSEESLIVSEGGESSYRLSLTSEPTGAVIVEIIIPEYGEVLIVDRGSTRVLDQDNWSDGEEVIVTLIDDSLFNEDRMLTIMHRVIDSDDPNYEEDLDVAGVEVTLDDNQQQPGLLLELMPDYGKEGSDANNNTIVRVTAIVSLDGVSRSEMTRGTLSLGGDLDTVTVHEDYGDEAPRIFTILPGQPSVEVPFDLELIADEIDEDNESLTITASDILLGFASARFTIRDDDTARVAVSLEDQRVREGGAIPYTVVLESQPIANVEVVVTVVEGRLNSEAQPGNVTVAAVEGILPLTFTPINWSTSQALLLTVTPTLDAFGELQILHTINSIDDPTYDALPPVSVYLELIDVDVDLRALEVMTANRKTTDLLNADGGPVNFSAGVRHYFAAVPSPDKKAYITATPSDIDPREQEQGQVRIFREDNDGTLELLSEEDVAGTATEVDLSDGANTYTFLIVVSARSIQSVTTAEEEELIRQTYTLTLRRALPTSAKLQVYLADDADRKPITTLDFGPDEHEMALILILRDDDTRYSISEISHSDLVVGLEFLNKDGESGTDATNFETPVTLSREENVHDDDVPYSLTFTATPKRAMADANPLSATIGGTLKANTATRTKIQATYLGEHQDEKEPISPDEDIKVSDNGTVTIELSVVRIGGGDRPFSQSDFSITTIRELGGAETVELMEDGAGYTIEIASRTGLLSLTVKAEGSLGSTIVNPADLNFTVSFESPQAVIRPVANLDPLFAFRRPFFAFVGEDNELPLEVVLVGDIPLADSDSERDRILSELALAVNLSVDEGDTPKTVTIAASDSAPGRVLTFAISDPKNSVTVDVAVDGPGSKYVEVDNLVFTAHFLSLRHDEEIDFREDPDLDLASRISELSLSGEDPNDDSWSFRVANEVELARDQYEVLEVILDEAEKMISVMITKIVTNCS